MLSLSESRPSPAVPKYSLTRHFRVLVAVPGFCTLLAIAGAVGSYVWLR